MLRKQSEQPNPVVIGEVVALQQFFDRSDQKLSVRHSFPHHVVIRMPDLVSDAVMLESASCLKASSLILVVLRVDLSLASCLRWGWASWQLR